MNTIDKVSAKTTTLIVAHRLSTIKNCDKIFVLKEGCLVESGTHKALLRKKGVYARMWNSQNSQEN